MRIGLDIDNVLNNFDSAVLKEFIKEDKNKRGKGIINPKAEYISKGMFDWTKEEVDDFFASSMEKISLKLPLRKNCKKYIDKLMSEGHEIFLISNRVYPHYLDGYNSTLKWLKDKNIKFDKLIISSSPDKSLECKQNNIDVMVDDRVSQCDKMAQEGINTIVMKAKYNHAKFILANKVRALENKPLLKLASSWERLYNMLEEFSKK